MTNPIQAIRLAHAYKTAVRDCKEFRRIIEPEPVMRSTTSVDAFDEAGRRTIRRTYWTFIRMLSALLPKDGGGFVADFGCGPANLDIMLSRTMGNLDITAIELGPEMIAKARKNIVDAHRDSMITIVHGDATIVKLSTANKNAASISLFLAHHLQDPEALRRLLMNMLWHVSPSGAVLLVDFVRPPTRELAERIVKLSPTGIPANDEDFMHSLLAGFSQQEWKEAVQDVNREGLGRPLSTITVPVSVFPPSIPALTAVYLEGEGARRIPLRKDHLPHYGDATFSDKMLMGIIESGFRRGGFEYL
ncbi:MAG: class I SAM-dependent methyltransferase [Candidatus Micrarchaeota archaeon]